MLNDTSFPLYAFEKDDLSMFLIARPDEVFHHIEPIDFENDEYLFWDAQGRAVKLTLERGTLTDIEEAENDITVREAFARYSQALGATVDTTGTLAEVWARLQTNVRPPSLLSRMVRNALGIGCSLIVLVVVAFTVLLVADVIKAAFVRYAH
jgi:hypothetical protein